jgi:glycosyltransferase involved in cell wall biosynthesis
MYQVTIVIPHYNGLQRIKDCLDSLSLQTFQNFTTVVIDNHSSDGSSEYIRDHYSDCRIPGNEAFEFPLNAGTDVIELVI